MSLGTVVMPCILVSIAIKYYTVWKPYHACFRLLHISNNLDIYVCVCVWHCFNGTFGICRIKQLVTMAATGLLRAALGAYACIKGVLCSPIIQWLPAEPVRQTRSQACCLPQTSHWIVPLQPSFSPIGCKDVASGEETQTCTPVATYEMSCPQVGLLICTIP